MADDRLQELARRWRETGDAADEATWLQARVRAGDLARERLELAIYLGSAGAREAYEGDPPPHCAAPKSGVRGWVRNLEPWGAIPCLRATVAGTRILVADDATPPDGTSLRPLHLAEAYLVEPDPALIAEARDLPWNNFTATRKNDLGRWRACELCGIVLTFARRSGNNFAWKAKAALQAVAADLRSEASCRARVTAELLPWVLGTGDPVRERVQAREGSALPAE